MRSGFELGAMSAPAEPGGAFVQSKYSHTQAKYIPFRYLSAICVANQGLAEYRIGPGIVKREQRSLVDLACAGQLFDHLPKVCGNSWSLFTNTYDVAASPRDPAGMLLAVGGSGWRVFGFGVG
jgi:hypothetical protein